jgi:hypothetical protein
MRCTVYIPTHPDQTLIAAGSGIVGVDADGGVDVWFEGNLYGASNLVTFQDRVAVAASRMEARYPTRARALLPAGHLCAVGTYDTETGVLDLTDPAAVDAWAGTAVVS